jgi:hypothetical protein
VAAMPQHMQRVFIDREWSAMVNSL